MIYPLVLGVVILVFLIIMYIVFSNKSFEKHVFRVDSDNITWVLLSIILFLGFLVISVNTDWIEITQGSTARALGYITGWLLFLIGSVFAWNKAKAIAKQRK